MCLPKIREHQSRTLGKDNQLASLCSNAIAYVMGVGLTMGGELVPCELARALGSKLRVKA